MVGHHGDFKISFVLKVQLHPIGILLGLEIVVVLEEKVSKVNLVICDGNFRIKVALSLPLDESLRSKFRYFLVLYCFSCIVKLYALDS